MSRYERHVFVCINERPADNPKGCCLSKGSAEIRERFKARLKELGVHKRVRANAAGCLDACATGPTVVIYPEGVWYQGVSASDVEEIIQKHVLRGEVVERLLMPASAAGPRKYPPLTAQEATR